MFHSAIRYKLIDFSQKEDLSCFNQFVTCGEDLQFHMRRSCEDDWSLVS